MKPLINTLVLAALRRSPENSSFVKRVFRRSLSTTSSLGHYEGDGKTTVTILNHEIDSPLMVDAYHQSGFRLNNGFAVMGPMALFPKTVLSWDVASSQEVTPEALALFALLEPKLDILVIGVGDAGNTIPKEAIQYMRKMKINFEILATDHALTTFNFLNFERRCVAAALIPPITIRMNEMDIINTKIKRKKSYEEVLDS